MKIVTVTLIISCHINANWPGKITWHVATLIRTKLLIHTGSAEAGFTSWHTKLSDPLLPSQSPQINTNRFLLNSISFTCSLSHICSPMAHMPSVTGCLSHILFSRPARVFYNTYFKPALGSRNDTDKNSELPQQQSTHQSQFGWLQL